MPGISPAFFTPLLWYHHVALLDKLDDPEMRLLVRAGRRPSAQTVKPAAVTVGRRGDPTKALSRSLG
jgi:hypothetical protein